MPRRVIEPIRASPISYPPSAALGVILLVAKAEDEGTRLHKSRPITR
jgi:hypothetical protein